MPSHRAVLPVSALLAGLVSGCQSADWAMYNLRETHHFDGSVRRVGNPLSPAKYALVSGVSGLNLRFELGADLLASEPHQIDDPLADSLQALVALEELGADGPRSAGLAVEAFTWLAVEDDYVLARERAVLGLGAAGARLGLTGGPRALPADAVPVGPDAVASAFSALVRATGATVGAARAAAGEDLPMPPDRTDAGPAPAVSEACVDVAGLVLDRQGARRLLGVVNGLVLVPRLRAADRAALEDLSLDLQRRCVQQTLAAALGDPHGLVRAAALQACVESSGNRLPVLLRQAFNDVDERVHVRALEMLQEHGIPRLPQPLTPLEQEAYEDAWREDLLALSLHRDTRVGTAACKVLSLHAGAGFSSLRPEDWTAWERRRGAIAP